MADKRMFSLAIIDSDVFLDMPLTAQALYFHLSMRGDDDGFINNPKKIQRMLGASDEDLSLLVSNNFIIPFDSGIVAIKHWKAHNYIRSDRKKDTVYPEEMAMLEIKENGVYDLIDEEQECRPNETKRQRAYRLSTLPYSFEWKIRNAFYGKKCPICGAVMHRDCDDGIGSDNRIPTIQHNMPISKGGKHELGNISVICRQCNVSIRDQETGKLNADEVIEVWDNICRSTDRQMTDKCQHRVDKSSIDKISVVAVSNVDNIQGDTQEDTTAATATPKAPTYDELVKKYGKALVDEKMARAKRYKNTTIETVALWCEDAVKKKKQSGGSSFKRDYDMDELERSLIDTNNTT